MNQESKNKFIQFIKNYQQQIVLIIGYLLVALIAFGLGRMTSFEYKAPEIKIEQATVLPDNYTPNSPEIQCNIKGTSSKIYHIAGQSNYNNLKSPVCFETEAAAQAAGFRKSLR